MNPTQRLLSFEQVTVDATQATEAAIIQAKAEAERQEELAKMMRRLHRDIAHRERTPDQVAQCGIRWYCRSPRDRDRGNYWTHCHHCGKPLTYYDSNEESEAHNTEPCIRPGQTLGQGPAPLTT